MTDKIKLKDRRVSLSNDLCARVVYVGNGKTVDKQFDLATDNL